MKNSVYLILSLILLSSSCNDPKLKIEVLNSKTLQNIPSASGIAKKGNLFYLIGDDSPFLFSIDSGFSSKSKSIIYSTNNMINERIQKEYKPDFEALELINNNELVVFGSGSTSPQRDIFKHITITDSVDITTYQISSFYTALKQSEILDNKELNIEAVAFYEGSIYLFNRGENIIFTFIYKDLIQYFKGESSFPKPKTALFKLPKINGIEAGFSGATISKKGSFIIFTASVENTDNAYNDGDILGSFVGVIEIEKGNISTSFQFVKMPDFPYPLKIESVAIDRYFSKKELNIVLVTDSDGGESLILECKLIQD